MSSVPQTSLSEIENPHLKRTFDPTLHVAGVRFEKLGKLYHFDYQDYPHLIPGDFVLVETVRGQQLGEVIGFVERDDSIRDYKPITRIATPRDLLIRQQWQQREIEALINCREAAAEMGRFENVKFIKAEYTFDGKTCAILYTTEDEVNLNALRKTLRTKIEGNVEFRQIGPRDVARILGGQGACGGPRCCSTFLTEFSPISIKMAKMQGIPLNPTEITGMCGRLRCCLLYEYEQYVEARKVLPRKGKRIGTPHGEGRVIEVYPLRDAVTVEVEDQRHLVEREQLIPLEEFRKLQEKAEAGCTKNEGGGCDCGSRRPKSASQDLNAALEMAHATAVDGITGLDGTTEGDEEDAATEVRDSPSGKSKPRKRNKRRGESVAGEHQTEHSEVAAQPQNTLPEAKADRISASGTEQPKPKGGGKRRRNKKRGGGGPKSNPPKGEN